MVRDVVHLHNRCVKHAKSEASAHGRDCSYGFGAFTSEFHLSFTSIAGHALLAAGLCFCSSAGGRLPDSRTGLSSAYSIRASRSSAVIQVLLCSVSCITLHQIASPFIAFFATSFLCRVYASYLPALDWCDD